ncbi:hypothetical protein HDZ31DRAFT_70167, partial [Schizophyllum fasciatum]
QSSRVPITSHITTTGEDGDVVTITTTPPGQSSADSTSTSSAAPSETSSESDGDDKGLSTGSIVGMSVAGGIALIGIIAFFVWKFTQKRLADYDDEAIKWPELNAHPGDSDAPSHAMPVNPTGRFGVNDAASEVSLSRSPSQTAYSTNYSTAELATNDPYAVPPLPHLNPNSGMPYRDDPNTGYYDPYRGPVPQTFNDGQGQVWQQGGEAIPMTQMAPPPSGRLSPGPSLAYGMDGRASPNPSVMRAASPNPMMATRAVSPAPQMGGVPPQMAYDMGRRSPGPQAAYGLGAQNAYDVAR